MEVREAFEADADRLAELADTPADVMRNLVHDRTVRVLVERTSAGDGASEGAAADENGTGDDAETIRGFVSFDARDGVVHVTQLAGDQAACDRLLEEPIGFARGESMAVEVLVPETDEAVVDAVEGAGFDDRGVGPHFEGVRTTRYRLEPEPATR